MKRIFILVFLYLMNIMVNHAQTISMSPPIIIPVSPEAADVQRYVSYPVDYSTGIPDIHIPLYEIKSGDIVLPITLSYHSAGLKPKEPSGRIGTGWTLNAEPSVMRSIRGVADGSLSLALSGNQTLTNQICQDLIDVKKDGEPDQYSYTLNPGGGSFYMATFDHTRYVNYPRSNNKVEISGDKVSITTGDGLVYRFGDGDNAVEKTECIGFNPQTTRWLCNSITSLKTKAEITFSYKQGALSYIDYYYNMHDYKIIEQSNNKVYNYFTDSYIGCVYTLYMNGNKINYDSK